MFEPSGPQQAQVVASTAILTVVLGGAGTGKTTSSLAAARAHLDRLDDSNSRALFLSFSRAAVGRVVMKSHHILESRTSQVETMTFHGLAFSIVRRFGSIVGLADARLVSPAREKLVSEPEALGYDALIPTALKIIRASPTVAQHLRARWSLVIVDEYQDTDNLQVELLEEVSLDARVILLGDPNQCIYTFRASDGVRLERINEAMDAAGEENTIEFPEASLRDPTQVIPAMARAIQRREFNSAAVATAIRTGRLEVRTGIRLEDETETVRDVVEDLAAEGLGVAVFTHHNNMLAALSDGLEAAGIDHEIAGLSDSLACALDALSTMLLFAGGTASWDDVLLDLGVFVNSAGRGNRVPQLSMDIIHGTGAATLQQRLGNLRDALQQAHNVQSARLIAVGAHDSVGLPSKSSAWQQASSLLSPMVARALRQLGAHADLTALAIHVAASAREATVATLTESTVEPRAVQLMNLYQTKGREADATVVILREGDFMGSESEPFPSTSRLLYVVFSRARQRIIVLLIGSGLPPAVAPLRALASS